MYVTKVVHVCVSEVFIMTNLALLNNSTRHKSLTLNERSRRKPATLNERTSSYLLT